MTDLLVPFLLLANGDQPAPQAPALPSLMMPLVIIFFLFYFLILRPQRREQKRRDEMLKGLKKNDRVITAGGIIGTVANITPDGKEVTVKVDDNTRIKFLRSSIQSVPSLEAEEAAGKAPAPNRDA